ncbi:MAG: DMT family transporter [Pseudomonadota bacterium]
MEIDANFMGEIYSVACTVMWAAAVVLFKKSGETVDPFSLNMFKNVLALVLFTPTVLLAGDSLFPADSAWSFGVLAVSGILGISIADTLLFMCLNRLGASLTAIVDCMYAPSALFIAFVLFGEKIGTWTIVGAALIISAILIGSLKRRDFKMKTGDLVAGIVYGALSMFFMAFGIVMIKKPIFGHEPVLENQPLLWVTWFRLLAGTAAMVLVSLMLPKPGRFYTVFRFSAVWKTMVPASILGTYLSMVVWLLGWKLIESAGVAAVLNQLTLIFVMIFAGVFLKEKIDLRKILAVFMALAGGIITVLG